MLGIGNLIATDDALGIHALGALECDPRVPTHTEFLDGGTFGVQLAGYVHGVRRLLVLDAIDVGAAPGTVSRLKLDGTSRLLSGATAHESSLGDFLSALCLLGEAPDEVLVLGIQPASTAWGDALTPAVAAALPLLVDAAVAELNREGGAT